MRLDNGIETLNKPWALMLDYDGTLTPLCSHFNESQIDAKGLALLESLAALPEVQLAIVSGRSVDQLMGFLGSLEFKRLLLVGLHGGEVFDMHTATWLVQPDAVYKTRTQELVEYLLDKGMHALEAVHIEDKVHSVAVHYRQAHPHVAEKALSLFQQGFERLQMASLFSLKPGKALLEALPKAFNKGHGVRHVQEKAKTRFAKAPGLIYIGDDVTDFDAFAVVNEAKGLSYYVGEQLPPGAPAVVGCLDSVESVRRFLHLMAQAQPDPSAFRSA
jgi:trehalose-phosphatase